VLQLFEPIYQEYLMAAFTYSLDLTPIQADIVSHFESEFAAEVIVDGFLDTEEVPKFSDGSVQPFIVLWFRGLRRSGSRRGTRAFAGPRLDSYTTGFDAVCVANNGTDARNLMNYVADQLVEWKPLNGGQVNLDSSLWQASRPIIAAADKPTRWAATQGFQFGVFQSRVPVVP
jgi:hypothetical protein